MNVDKTLPHDELNLQQVTQFLNLNYQKLVKEGQVRQLFETGVTKALPVKIQTRGPGGVPVDLTTTARLVVAPNREGNPEVQIVVKNEGMQLDRYRDIDLHPEQQQELLDGKTLVVRDRSEREHIIKFDRELNRVGGMKKSAFLAPEQVGSSQTGYAKLDSRQQAELKRGNAIEVEVRGTPVKVQLDPIERRLHLSEIPRQSLDVRPERPRKINPGPSR